MRKILVAMLALVACAKTDNARTDTGAGRSTGARAEGQAQPCPGDNAGLKLSNGFCATVFADSVGHARHIAVAPNGDVYVNTWSGSYYGNEKLPAGGFLVVLRDSTRDGKADVVARFGTTKAGGGSGGTGIALFRDALYAEEGSRIVRYALPAGGLAPTAKSETIVSGLPLTGDHPMHPFAIDSGGAMYLSSGSATNSCQTKNRTLESPGRKPCTELETRAGVWLYDAKTPGHAFSAKERYATGIRNPVGITIAPDNTPWVTQHGRDQLAENWPKLYTAQQGQDLPAEELMPLERGADFGWPYCYYDGAQEKLVLAPEYGGDGGKAVGECASKKAAAAAFPAHMAPDGIVFYTGSQFPARYKDGVFIAFHGSWNRAPGPQEGYYVVFQPLTNGKPSGKFEIFADDFAGPNKQPDAAQHRPVGVAQGPDGALYVTDDKAGRVYRITYGAANH